VIRFTNDEVFSNIGAVVVKIQKELQKNSPPLEGLGEVYEK
jgi:very-short-patch-repair endonuclease